jgi:hypothetical protein
MIWKYLGRFYHMTRPIGLAGAAQAASRAVFPLCAVWLFR